MQMGPHHQSASVSSHKPCHCTAAACRFVSKNTSSLAGMTDLASVCPRVENMLRAHTRTHARTHTHRPGSLCPLIRKRP
eukprot:759255-Rhodomonas_salina.1